MRILAGCLGCTPETNIKVYQRCFTLERRKKNPQWNGESASLVEGWICPSHMTKLWTGDESFSKEGKEQWTPVPLLGAGQWARCAASHGHFIYSTTLVAFL